MPHHQQGEFVSVVDHSSHRALYSRSLFKKGAVILYAMGVTVKQTNKYSIQLDLDLHLEPTHKSYDFAEADSHLWPFLNHSVNPNTRFIGRELLATRDIASGEELTFNYNANEWDMSEPFTCIESGSLVRGYRYLSQNEREQLRTITAPFLLILAEQDRANQMRLRSK